MKIKLGKLLANPAINALLQIAVPLAANALTNAAAKAQAKRSTE